MSPWLLVSLGTGQVLGNLGAQVSLRLGPQEVQRPLGPRGWEAAGPEDQYLRGRAGLGSEWDPGGGMAPLSDRGRVWSARDGRAPIPPHPSSQPPGPTRTRILPVTS